MNTNKEIVNTYDGVHVQAHDFLRSMRCKRTPIDSQLTDFFQNRERYENDQDHCRSVSELIVNTIDSGACIPSADLEGSGLIAHLKLYEDEVEFLESLKHLKGSANIEGFSLRSLKSKLKMAMFDDAGNLNEENLALLNYLGYPPGS